MGNRFQLQCLKYFQGNESLDLVISLRLSIALGASSFGMVSEYHWVILSYCSMVLLKGEHSG